MPESPWEPQHAPSHQGANSKALQNTVHQDPEAYSTTKKSTISNQSLTTLTKQQYAENTVYNQIKP